MNMQPVPVRIFISILLAVVFQGCGTPRVRTPRYPFHVRTVSHFLKTMEEQRDAVRNFVSSGRIRLRDRGSGFEADVLIVATRNPLRMKLEVTHFWGRPLFHLLLDESGIIIVSFPDKTYYTGDGTGLIPSRLLPVRLRPDQLWAAVRGFPVPVPGNRAVSSGGDRVSFLDENGDAIQHVEFRNDNGFSVRAEYPGQGLRIAFSKFSRKDMILYARRTRLTDRGNGTNLTLDTRQIVFNTSIDKAIFDLTVPPGFHRLRDHRPLDTHRSIPYTHLEKPDPGPTP